MSAADDQRFWTYLPFDLKSDECWGWSGSRADGYGLYRVGRRTVRAHRYAYELVVGPIPEGLTIDHLCRNRGCVNPAHLEPVPIAENIRRMFEATGRGPFMTHCKNGHAFSSDNVRVDKRGVRICRSCITEAVRRHRARKVVA